MAEEPPPPPPPPAPTGPGLRSRFWRAIASPLGLLVILIIYSFVGAILFKVIEGPHESHEKYNLIEMREEIIDSMWNHSAAFKNREAFEDLVKNELRKYESQLYSAFAGGINSDSEDVVWDFWGSMVYCLTIYTTIGYGHICPSTDVGKIVTMIYALIGIPLCLIVLAEFGKLLTVVIKYMYAIPRSFIVKNGKYPIDEEFNLPPIIALLISVVYILGGVVMYTQWEDWSYLDAFYFIFISVSTVGFGDVLPDDAEFFIASFCYQLFGLALVAMVLNVIMESLQISLTQFKVGFLETTKSIGIDLSVVEDEKAKTE